MALLRVVRQHKVRSTVRRVLMTPRKTLMLAALISMAPAGLVLAQSQTMPADSPPADTSASSPSSPSTQAPPVSNDTSSSDTTPAAASSTKSTHMASKQAMKDCVTKQQSDNSGLSTADA